jgi:pantoate--beta-alanine ligase
MFLIKTTKDLETVLHKQRTGNKKIGFVATMGALHKGHVSLIERSKKENDTTICSIFVNPKQFNDKNDLLNYPRPIERDIIILEEAGCDALFLPEPEEIYPESYRDVSIELGALETVLEGAMRPGHFKGVALVVKRLFECVKPDRAYFGQKDFQQTLVIKELVKQFNLPIEIIVNDILREDNGLAMSSRNIRLNKEHKNNAGFIYRALQTLKDNVFKMSFSEAIEIASNEILKHEGTRIEYLEIVDAEKLDKMDEFLKGKKAVALIVVNYYGVRLLDNLIINE